MSSGVACVNKAHRPYWWVETYRANYSAFNGYARTPSDYSAVRCSPPHDAGPCSPHHVSGAGAYWRTKAAYVDTLPHERPTA